MSALGPILDPLVPGDRSLTATWTNDPALNINNAFLFVLNKATNEMTKLNLTDAEAESEEYVIADPSLALVNGVEYLVQYVQQQNSATGITYGSNTRAGIPAGLPATPVLSLVEEGTGTATVMVSYRGNNGAPYTSVEFKICDLSINVMQLDQSFNFPPLPVPASISDVSYTIVDLSNNTPYSIACYVYNEFGSCVRISNSIQLNPTDQPNPPANVKALSGENSQVIVTFANSAQPSGVTVATWQVQRALYGSSSYTPIQTVLYNPDVSYAVIDTTAVNGTGYQYRINATSTDGLVGPYSVPVTAVAFKPVEIGLFNVIPGDSEAACGWTVNSAGATFVSPPNVVYYDLTVGTGTSFVNTATFYDLSYIPTNKIVTGLTNGTAYNFRVRAKSLIPNSLRDLVDNPAAIVAGLPYAVGAWVNQTDVTPATTPGAPTNLAANVDSHFAQVTWQAPASNGGSPIIRYSVYQYLSQFDASNNLNPTLAAVVTGIPLEEYANIMGLINNTEYFFRVTASNLVGEGPLSVVLGPVIPFDTVNPPILLSTTQLDASSAFVDISLNWTSPEEEIGITIYGFNVFRVSASGVYTPVGSNPKLWTQYDSINPDGTRTFSVNDYITPVTQLSYTYAVQTIALNPYYPPGPQYYNSVFAFVVAPVAKPPTITGDAVIVWDSIQQKSFATFTVNTFDLPIVGAVLYAPPLSDEPPLPTPITMGDLGAAVNGPYVFEVDYQIPTALVSQAYFVMVATAGGSANRSVGI